jgi:hypothetical protein
MPPHRLAALRALVLAAGLLTAPTAPVPAPSGKVAVTIRASGASDPMDTVVRAGE